MSDKTVAEMRVKGGLLYSLREYYELYYELYYNLYTKAYTMAYSWYTNILSRVRWP